MNKEPKKLKEKLKEEFRSFVPTRITHVLIALAATIPVLALFSWCYSTFETGGALAVIIIVSIFDIVCFILLFRLLLLKRTNQSENETEDKIVNGEI